MAREKGMGNLQREKSGRWTMRVGIGGKRYCRSTRTKDRDQAERVLQRFLAPFGLGEHRLPLADVWMEYVKSPNRNELAKATLDYKRHNWMHFATWMERFYLPVKDLGDVTADMIAEYLACARAEDCARTYNARVCVLREIFRVLSKKAGLTDDPWEGVRLRPENPHSRRELSMDELRRLLEAAKRVPSTSSTFSTSTTSSTPEWHTLFLIGIYTGLRLGDCCRLNWSQINLSQGVIQLVPQKTRRHHQRMVTIPIHPALGQALLGIESKSRVEEICKSKSEGEVEQRCLSTCSAGQPGNDATHRCSTSTSCFDSSSTSTFDFDYGSGPVLPTIAEMYARAHWQVSHQLSKIFKAANIQMSVRLEGRKHRTPEATFHSLRHTFVSFAANAGVPLHIVQSIVGHESTAMTRHYYHENLDALKSAVAAIPTL